MSIGYVQWTKIGCFRWTRSGCFRRTLTFIIRKPPVFADNPCGFAYYMQRQDILRNFKYYLRVSPPPFKPRLPLPPHRAAAKPYAATRFGSN